MDSGVYNLIREVIFTCVCLDQWEVFEMDRNESVDS